MLVSTLDGHEHTTLHGSSDSGHHYTYPSSALVVVLVCSTSVTVTSPSLDSLRLEVFLTFLVLRSVVVYWTCTSTSAMALVGVVQEDTISPDAVATRIRMASNGGRIAGIIPECLALGTVGGVWDLNLEECGEGRCAGGVSELWRLETACFPIRDPLLSYPCL